MAGLCLAALVACTAREAFAQTRQESADDFLRAAQALLAKPEAASTPGEGVAFKLLTPEIRDVKVLRERLKESIQPTPDLDVYRAAGKEAVLYETLRPKTMEYVKAYKPRSQPDYSTILASEGMQGGVVQAKPDIGKIIGAGSIKRAPKFDITTPRDPVISWNPDSILPYVVEMDDLLKPKAKTKARQLPPTPPAGSPPRVAYEKFLRLLGDRNLATVQLMAANFSVFDKVKPEKPIRLCAENQPLCRPLQTAGWLSKRDGRREMTAILARTDASDRAGRAIFVENKDDILGTINVGNVAYVVEKVNGGNYLITSSTTKDRNPNDVLTLRNRADRRIADPAAAAAPAASTGATLPVECPNPATLQVLDVLVSITPKAWHAAIAAGTNLWKHIHLAEVAANGSFKISDINGRIDLKPYHYNTYVESGNFETDINEYLDPKGRLSDVRKARRDSRADVAILLVNEDNETNCGLAADIGADKDKAFAVVNWRCLATKYSFIHEIGHLAGAWHDPKTLGPGYKVDPPYAYGYITTGQYPIATIMAYPQSCPTTCDRDYYWSNPHKKSDDGQDLGSQTSFDACIWRQRLPIMTKFKGG